MTDTFITNGEERIAKLMGLVYKAPDIWEFDHHKVDKDLALSRFRSTNPTYIYNLEFHTNYKWVMYAVEKVESIGSTIVKITGDKCEITPVLYDIKSDSLKTHEPISETRFSNKMFVDKQEIIFAAIVEFLKWYDKHNESKK